MEYRIKKINEVTRGWINYFRIAYMKTKMQVMDGRIRRHLRMIIWKQWKKPKRRRIELTNLGMRKKWAARCAGSRKGYFVMSKKIGSVLTNKYLEEKGLLSMADHYNKKHHTIQLQFVGL